MNLSRSRVWLQSFFRPVGVVVSDGVFCLPGFLVISNKFIPSCLFKCCPIPVFVKVPGFVTIWLFPIFQFHFITSSSSSSPSSLSSSPSSPSSSSSSSRWLSSYIPSYRTKSSFCWLLLVINPYPIVFLCGNRSLPVSRYSDVRWEELRDVQKIRCSSGAFAALLGSGKAGSPGQVAGDQGVFPSTCRASKMPQKNRFHGTMSRFEGPFADTAIHISQHGDIPYGGVKMDLATGMHIHVAGPGRGKGPGFKTLVWSLPA